MRGHVWTSPVPKDGEPHIMIHHAPHGFDLPPGAGEREPLVVGDSWFGVLLAVLLDAILRRLSLLRVIPEIPMPAAPAASVVSVHRIVSTYRPTALTGSATALAPPAGLGVRQVQYMPT